jgi:hypothetical protein
MLVDVFHNSLKNNDINIICIAGLFIFYLPLAIYFYSFRCILVFVNGLLFHLNKNNFYIKIYDIFCNLLMMLWSNYYYPYTFLVSTFSVFIFFINTYLKKMNIISQNITDIIHLLFVQFPLALSLKSTLE